MKKLFTLICLLAFAFVVNAQTSDTKVSKKDKNTATKYAAENTEPSATADNLVLRETEFDFGKIPQGKPVEYDVILKNVSGDSVKIENVQVGCGCTTPKWKPGPYAAGETFKVTLGYNAMSDGVFNKNATIFFNNGLKQVVRFHGETFKAPENAAPANAAVQKLNPKS